MADVEGPSACVQERDNDGVVVFLRAVRVGGEDGLVGRGLCGMFM